VKKIVLRKSIRLIFDNTLAHCGRRMGVDEKEREREREGEKGESGGENDMCDISSDN